ncbi:MAG: hypothetical protein ACKO96_27390, partial [Flammeovirgaceae bacterium]
PQNPKTPNLTVVNFFRILNCLAQQYLFSSSAFVERRLIKASYISLALLTGLSLLLFWFSRKVVPVNNSTPATNNPKKGEI